jgi:exodeoxyribonuclease VII large subunit
MLSLAETDPRKIYSVTEVTADIRGLLEDSFPSVWVSGEISNFKAATSGHFYFTFKDSGAQIAAVMFRPSNRALKFSLEDGLAVILHGRVTVYGPRGQYQLIVDGAEPQGLGALQLALEQLKKKLLSEGLFDEAHKKPLPFLPRRVGIVTSSKGAAMHDMISILKRRLPNIDIVVNPVKVQGAGSAEEIAQAIAEMNARADVDVLIVGRGGGSIEDLWAFNEEIVVRTIYASDIPIISAVGHETDFTLADLVADVRAPTPSAAAELAVPEKADLLLTLVQHRSGLQYAIRQYLNLFNEKLLALKKSLKSPVEVLEGWTQRVDELNDRLNSAAQRLLLVKRHAYREASLSLPDPKQRLRELKIRIEGFRKRLENLSPFAPLARGYSLLLKEGGQAVRSVNNVRLGETLMVKLGDGNLKVKVI